MKMTLADFAKLGEAVRPLDTPERRTRYATGNYPNAERTKDINLRYRWDLLHASRFDTKELYRYLDDDRIDTALRHLVPPL